MAGNPFLTRNELRLDVSGTVSSRGPGICSVHQQRACHRRRSVASRAMEARDTFPIGMDLKRGKCWGNNLVFRHSRCRKHRVSAATPWSMSSGHGSNEVLNPLSRDDPERARINTFITILAETPVEEWKPAILDEYLSSLLRGHLYRQAMTERLSNVRSGEEREALTRVDAFLTGYLGQERRKASRKKVSDCRVPNCASRIGNAVAVYQTAGGRSTETRVAFCARNFDLKRGHKISPLVHYIRY